MPKQYEISITVTEIDEEGNQVLNWDGAEEAFQGDLSCELTTDANPVSVLLKHLQTLPGTSGFCT